MKLSFINMDDIFDSSRVITNAEIMDKSKAFTDDGPYSEKVFGKIHGDEIEYSCKCGALRGRIYEGLQCDECSTIVEKKESVISRVGWIDLKEYKVIHPRFYQFIQQYIGTARLKSYIDSNMSIDVDGNVVIPDETELKPTAKDPMPECVGMGVEAFIANFDSILETYHTKNKDDKKDIYDIIRQNRDKLFMTKIPVYSPRLRPVVVIKDRVITDPLNEKYVQILKLTAGLHSLSNDRNELSVAAYCNKIQQLIVDIDNFVILALNGKKGLIRNTVLGSRLNFSSRCVITPLPKGTALDEVHLPYIVGLEMFKLQILNFLKRKKDISYFEAMTIFNNAVTVFDEEIYEYMMRLLGPNGHPFLLNRNPTISIGSILYMRLTKIKTDITDMTLSIRNNVLKFLSGDYDGDVLNIFLTLFDEYSEDFAKFSPINLAFSLNDGKFNSNLSLDKDYALGLQTLLD